jgi:N-formylglutamate amidohydrolase
MVESATECPFMRIGPEEPTSPVVLSVPHAGRAYSEALLKTSRLPREKLETLEDRLMDRLIWRAVDAGIPAFIANVPRAEIDLNRDEREIDASMVAPALPQRSVVQSARTLGGLGLIPSRITGSGSIWLQRLPAAELSRRIQTVYRPYHEALEEALGGALRRFGIAILLDCHSMPPREGEAGVVFGDRHGTSIAPELIRAAIEAAEACGYGTARNKPYAGGYITSRHGRPKNCIHALQIEIDRSLYLDERLSDPGPGFDAAAQMIADVVKALSDKALEPPEAIAAE